MSYEGRCQLFSQKPLIKSDSDVLLRPLSRNGLIRSFAERQKEKNIHLKILLK